jgi:hypothetical protein
MPLKDSDDIADRCLKWAMEFAEAEYPMTAREEDHMLMVAAAMERLVRHRTPGDPLFIAEMQED